MRCFLSFVFLAFFLGNTPVFPDEKGMTIKGIRSFSYASFTRIVFEMHAAAPYVITKTPDGKKLIFGAYNMPLVVPEKIPVVRDGVVGSVELHQDAGKNSIVITLDSDAGEVKDFVLRSPDRIVIDIMRKSAGNVLPSLRDVLTVVLDSGHGGKDGGITTSQGTEKVFTLDVGLRIKKILQKKSGFKVILTREKDQTLSWDERASAGNAAKGSLWISIHGAGSGMPQVYALDISDDPSPSVPAAKTDFLEFESGKEQQQMLWGKQQAAHIRESMRLGRSVANQLGGSATEPVPGPIGILKVVDAPAVLVECAITKNVQAIAEGIAQGIERYARETR
ncbi:MAG: N-acetylmuramoyl-L-alanine amidase [Nitrospirota bacterium]